MRTSVGKKPFSDKKYVPYNLISEYLRDIFSLHKEQDGYICIRSGPDTYAAQSWLDVDKISEHIKSELSRHDYRDTYFTFSTFKKSKRPQRTLERVQNIFAWSIDVDYKNEVLKPLDVYEYIMSNVSLPTPNYVEYGHRLRMIYIFAQPLRLFPKQRRTLLNGFNFLQSSFCKMINEQLGFMGESFGAEANPSSSFFRIPGSVNSKDGSTIQIAHLTDEKWTLRELFEEWIPDYITDPSGNKNEWYEEWKNQCGRRKAECGIKNTNFNSRMLWMRRMDTLKELRNLPNPHRKKLCFYYGTAITQIFGKISPDEFMQKLSEFNEGFAFPLSDHILRRVFQWQAKTQKLYRFCDVSIANDLDVDSTYFSAYTRKEKDAARYQVKRKTQLANGEAKCQKIEKRQRRVAYLLTTGMTLSDIAKELGVSLSTVKRDAKSKLRYTNANSEKTRKQGDAKSAKTYTFPIFLTKTGVQREGGACCAASIQGQSSFPTAAHQAECDAPARVNHCSSIKSIIAKKSESIAKHTPSTIRTANQYVSMLSGYLSNRTGWLPEPP